MLTLAAEVLNDSFISRGEFISADLLGQLLRCCIEQLTEPLPRD